MDKGYVTGNVDATIIAQAPKFRPFIDEMRKNVAEALRIPEDAVNIKATTEEGLGFTGAKEGIAAQAVCMIESIYESSSAMGDYGGCAGCAGCPKQTVS